MSRSTRRRLTAAQREALDALDAAAIQYADKLARLKAIEPCTAAWSPDVDGATRCQLLRGHAGPHRHRPAGAALAVVTW